MDFTWNILAALVLGWVAQRLLGHPKWSNSIVLALLVLLGTSFFIFDNPLLATFGPNWWATRAFWLADVAWLGTIKGFGSTLALLGAAPKTVTPKQEVK
jgi:hypothetical protein